MLSITLAGDNTVGRSRIVEALSIIQILTYAISFATNVLTTSIIGLYLWYAHRCLCFLLDHVTHSLLDQEISLVPQKEVLKQ